jgi:hypothetical protein
MFNDVKSKSDHPLIGCWHPQDRKFLDRLNLPQAKTQKRAQARDLILTETVVTHRSNSYRWTSYSRRPAYYARPSRYRERPMTYATMVPTIDELAREGYLEHEKSKPGHRGWQSRFRASGALIKMAESEPFNARHEPIESIVLRDANKKALEYVDNEETNRMRAELAEVNEAIRSSPIDYDGIPGRDGKVLFLPDGRKLTIQNDLHRVFSRGSFDLNGRFYGPTWQNLPKARRCEITIDGEATSESDHSWLHPRLLYAKAGKRLDCDPYDLPHRERRLVKIAFNVLVNADTELSARRAIAEEIGGKGAYNAAWMLIQEIKMKHGPVRDWFGSGAGLGLMLADSEMAGQVQHNLLRRGVLSLPIHDSFIVKAKHEGLLLDEMKQSFDEMATLLGGQMPVTLGYRKSVPQYGYTLAAPRLPPSSAPPSWVAANDNGLLVAPS